MGGVIISILRFDFGDGILWFIKVLIILYCSFFIFSVIRQRSSITGFVFLFLCALLLTYAGCFKGYMSYSIPMFYVGIVLSVSKKIGYNAVVLSIGLLTLNLLIGLAIFGRLIPLIVVTLVIASLIITFSSIKIDISIPAFLAAMSFDLYLVHYKVLWSLKSNIDYVPFIYYIAIAVITTVSFYLFRTKLLRLK